MIAPIYLWFKFRSPGTARPSLLPCWAKRCGACETRGTLSSGQGKSCTIYETSVSPELPLILPNGRKPGILTSAVGGRPTAYAAPFQAAVREALSSATPLESVKALFQHPLYKQAHPTPEHLLPLIISVAAAEPSDTKKTIFDGVDGIGLGWGMWAWHPAAASAAA